MLFHLISRERINLDISVILVSYNTAEITKVSLQHLFASELKQQMEVFIVDNASRDNSVEGFVLPIPMFHSLKIK